MKTLNIFFKLLFILFFLSTACSNSDDIEEEVTTKCFVVKILETDLPITNTRITFSGRFGCCCGGCGYGEIATGTTNNLGEVCITLSRLDFMDIERVACTLNGTYYEYQGSIQFSPNLTVIYVDTLF